MADSRTRQRQEEGIASVVVRNPGHQLHIGARSRRRTGDIGGPPDEGRIAFVSLRGSETSTSDDHDHDPEPSGVGPRLANPVSFFEK